MIIVKAGSQYDATCAMRESSLFCLRCIHVVIVNWAVTRYLANKVIIGDMTCTVTHTHTHTHTHTQSLF